MPALQIGPRNIFLDLDSKNLIYGVAKNRSESPGSFHWCNNDLRPAVPHLRKFCSDLPDTPAVSEIADVTQLIRLMESDMMKTSLSVWDV